MWQKSGLEGSDVVPAEEKKLESTVEPEPNVEISMAEIQKKLEFFLQGEDNNEEIFDWIDSNVAEERQNKPSFVRVLVTALFEQAYSGSIESFTVYSDKFRYRLPIFARYVAPSENLQLHTLYAAQAFMNRVHQPKGLLRQIFDFVYDNEIVREETFKKWEESTDPAELEGKGVALSAVAGFFTWLKENEISEESEEDETTT